MTPAVDPLGDLIAEKHEQARLLSSLKNRNPQIGARQTALLKSSLCRNPYSPPVMFFTNVKITLCLINFLSRDLHIMLETAHDFPDRCSFGLRKNNDIVRICKM